MIEYFAIKFFAVTGSGPWTEVLVSKPNAPSMVGQTTEPTGVTYKTWRAVIMGLAARNR